MLTSIALLWSLAIPADSILLRVFTINDLHGTLEARQHPWSNGRPVGGVAALKGMMDSLAAECRCPSLRLDAGDQMQGSLSSNLVFGRSAVEAMNLLRLDAAVIGNHELDWGLDTLAARIAEARYPWLVANVYDSATGRRPPWARPYALITSGAHRIAVIGYLTPLSKTSVAAERGRGLDFRGGRAPIADALAAAKSSGADLTMLVAHEGAFCDSLGCQGEIVDLARELDSTEVDLIVAGHTHSLIRTVTNGIPIISARSNGTALGVADLVRSADGRDRWKLRVETVYADRIRADPTAAALVSRYESQVEKLANRRIARLRDSLVDGFGEYPLGNLIADAQRAAGRADVAIMNTGGIRRSLFPGVVTYRDLFEVQPFGNRLVVLTITGADLHRAVEHAISGDGPDAHLAGMIARYDRGRPRGERIVTLTRTDGRAIIPTASYRLAVNDFMAEGGSGFAMFRGLPRRALGISDLDALIGWLRKLPQPVRAPSARRWIPVNQ